MDKKERDLIDTAKFYFLNCKVDEAVAEFNKVLKINPKNAEVYYHLGLICEHCNDFNEAREMYSKALTIDGEYKLAREHLNKLAGLKDE
jgi:Flp pilus assembly protein TadD